MLLTPEQAAVELQVTPETVRHLARAGRIPGARRVGRLWRFDPDKLKNTGVAECPSTDTPNPRIGGAASRLAAKKFANRQAQKSGRTPKSTNSDSEASTGVKLTLVSSTTHGKKDESGGPGSAQGSAA